MTNQKKGFTLIELLVVIAIIGILSAIGLVSLNGAREKARDAQRKSDIGQMNTALALYYDDNNSTYPTEDILDANIGTQADCIDDDKAIERVIAGGAWAVGGAESATATVISIWSDIVNAPMITTYLSRQLVPPGGATDNTWPNEYCYDSNAASAAAAGSSYVIYAGLEAGDGTTFFSLNSAGSSDDAQPPACDSSDNPCAV